MCSMRTWILFVAISPVLKGKGCWRISPGYPENQECFSLTREARAVRNKRWPLQVGLLLGTSASRGKGGRDRRPVASVGSVANFWVEFEHVACPPWDPVSWLTQMRGPNAYRLFHCLALQYYTDSLENNMNPEKAGCVSNHDLSMQSTSFHWHSNGQFSKWFHFNYLINLLLFSC